MFLLAALTQNVQGFFCTTWNMTHNPQLSWQGLQRICVTQALPCAHRARQEDLNFFCTTLFTRVWTKAWFGTIYNWNPWPRVNIDSMNWCMMQVQLKVSMFQHVYLDYFGFPWYLQNSIVLKLWACQSCSSSMWNNPDLMSKTSREM